MDKIWQNFLRLFLIIQFKDIELGGRSKSRINPWNPLSYIIILIFLSMYLVMYGFRGIKEKIDFKNDTNPFKWQ